MRIPARNCAVFDDDGTVIGHGRPRQATCVVPSISVDDRAVVAGWFRWRRGRGVDGAGVEGVADVLPVRAPDRCRANRCPRLMARARTIPAKLRPYWRRTTSLPKTGVARFRDRIRNFLGIGFLPNMRVFAAVEPIGIAMPAPAARRLPVRPWPSPPRRPAPSPPSIR